eukprot:TRINITY_DN47374_c0_g1_i1.p1 TRINITY_DN47374_c0_g1~~TRINITY_DN47374_c0_g1_i1.p1  ORF type:complete len:123 (+),score=15.75 TRINITY_DN47374_c0_g1_i1:81-449(+)
MKFSSTVLLPFCFIGVHLISLRPSINDDCGDNHMMCPDDETCCELDNTCCPDSTTSSGTGCCSISQATCCEGYCCFEGFQCQAGGGCTVSSSSKNSSLGQDYAPLWVTGIPLQDGSTLPPVL